METHGAISVRILERESRVPLSGATVAVTRKTDGGKLIVLSVQSTDNQGYITPVPIPVCLYAPHALCDIWADAPGHTLRLEEDVAVVMGEQVLRELELNKTPPD